MRILPVAQEVLTVQGEGHGGGNLGFRPALLLQVLRDGRVVICRVPEGLPGQGQAGGLSRLSSIPGQFRQHGGIIGGIHHDGDVGPVLGRRADHAGPADVDLLDGVLQGHPLAAHGLDEWVEVHHHHSQGLDRVPGQHLAMAGQVVPGQDPGVDARMQRLDPAVQDLGKPRIVGHRSHLDARIPQRPGRAPGGQAADSQITESPGQVRQPLLVRHTDESPFDLHRISLSAIHVSSRR